MGDKEWSEIVTGLRRERDEARAEVERLKDEATELTEEVQHLRRCCTQRGARMQILWGWIKGKHSHEAFLQCYPNAKKWFDEDGVPND